MYILIHRYRQIYYFLQHKVCCNTQNIFLMFFYVVGINSSFSFFSFLQIKICFCLEKNNIFWSENRESISHNFSIQKHFVIVIIQKNCRQTGNLIINMNRYIRKPQLFIFSCQLRIITCFKCILCKTFPLKYGSIPDLF